MNPKHIVAIALTGIGLATVVILVLSLLDPRGHIAISIIFCLVVMGLIVIGLVALRRLDVVSTSPVTILSSKTEVWLKDPAGELAEVVKTQNLVANVTGLTKLIDRGVSSDGPIEVTDAQCDGLEVDVNPKQIEPNNQRPLVFTFKEPPIKGKQYRRRLAFRFLDSFKNEKEYFGVRMTRPSEDLTLVLNFPPERPVKRAWLHYRDESFVVEADSPLIDIQSVDGKNRRLVYKVRRPVIGSNHRIWFEW